MHLILVPSLLTFNLYLAQLAINTIGFHSWHTSGTIAFPDEIVIEENQRKLH
jgi:hypothetical protein